MMCHPVQSLHLTLSEINIELRSPVWQHISYVPVVGHGVLDGGPLDEGGEGGEDGLARLAVPALLGPGRGGGQVRLVVLLQQLQQEGEDLVGGNSIAFRPFG